MTTSTAAPFATRTERETHYRAQLASSPRWALRALAIIYAAQTADERAAGLTSAMNGVGFTGRDAEILSSFARQVEAWNAEATHKYPSPLSPKQLVLLFRMMPKYTGQLIAHLEQTGAIPVIEKAKPAPVEVAEVAAIRARRATPQLPALSHADIVAAAERVEARRTAPTVRMPAAPIDLVALASRIQA